MALIPSNLIWVEKYRPNKIQDCILSEENTRFFQGIVTTKSMPNLLLHGSAGIGKTTIAQVLCEELGYTTMMLNSSDERGIDVLRTKMRSFASAQSFDGSKKAIILDEADNLTNDAQAALRGFIEDFSSNCAFILTCNHKNRLIDAIHSRCSSVNFQIPKSEMPGVLKKLIARIKYILEQESVICEKDEYLFQLLKNNYPDFRKTINELQRFAINHNNHITEGVLTKFANTNFSELFIAMRRKEFEAVRSWVIQNIEVDVQGLYGQFVKELKSQVEVASYVQSIPLIYDYQYKAMTCAPELGLLACLIELMVSLEWKAV
jgi:DNA polymerase III delta prime subunit